MKKEDNITIKLKEQNVQCNKNFKILLIITYRSSSTIHNVKVWRPRPNDSIGFKVDVFNYRHSHDKNKGVLQFIEMDETPKMKEVL